MTLAFAAGAIAGRQFRISHIFIFLGLCLAINAKQAFTVWMRAARAEKTMPLAVFSLQTFGSAGIFLVVLGHDLYQLLPFGLIPLAYLIFLRLLGEHSLVTEVAGFLLLSLAALIAGFLSTGTPDLTLYIAVALFYVAGVFKVRIQLQKKTSHRIVMAAYLIVASLVYSSLGVSLLLLLPLLDNLVSAATLYKARLSFTGWLEVAKGIAFTVLLAFLYAQ